MQKFIGAVSLVCGTAIGAGIIALPLALAKIGVVITAVLLIASLLVSYRTSCIMIDINHHLSRGASIVECSKILSGEGARILGIASFFALSFSLLSVYIACVADIIPVAFGQKTSSLWVILCGVTFCILFSLKIKFLSNVNAVFFVLLIISILAALFKVFVKSSFLPFFGNMPNINHIFSALPILFTSFGVQNVCPNVYDFLEKNPRKAKKAFLVGIVLAGVIYMSWIYVVLNSIYSTDPVFYEKMLGKNLNSGDLINKICEISGSKITHILLTSLSLLAIVTSAIGMAVGISVSLKEILKEIFKKYIPIITAALPTIAVLLIPNAFMNILAFGGMIATIFVIFLPIYLYSLIYKERKYDIKNILCVLFAIMVIYGELLAKN